MKQFTAHMRLGNIAAGRDAMSQPDVAADGRAAADGDTAKDRRARINDDIVLNDRMPGIAFNEDAVLVFLETLGAQRDGLIQREHAARSRQFRR